MTAWNALDLLGHPKVFSCCCCQTLNCSCNYLPFPAANVQQPVVSSIRFGRPFHFRTFLFSCGVRVVRSCHFSILQRVNELALRPKPAHVREKDMETSP